MNPIYSRPLFSSNAVNHQNSPPLTIASSNLHHEGNFKNLRKFTFSNGQIHEGEFKDGYLHGQGKITFPNGIIKTGEFKDGKLNGHGKISFSSGKIVEGEFIDDKLTGQGKISHHDGEIQAGEFKNGKLNGHGKISFPSGKIEEGEFVDNKLNGHGKISLPDGEIREGEFNDGKLNGQGKVSYPSGQIQEGEFNNGNFYKSIYPQIPLPKKRIWSRHRNLSPYITSKSLNGILEEFGLSSRGITEQYIWSMRRFIFGFSIGQKENIAELSKQSMLKLKELKGALEEGDVGLNMLYIFQHLTQLLRTSTQTQNSDYLKSLRRLHSDLQRSLPFAFLMDDLEFNHSKFTQLKIDICQKLKQMRPKERFLFPIGSVEHATLLIFQKEANGKILATHYNTGDGVRLHPANDLTNKKFSKHHHSTSKIYPPFDLVSHQDEFNEMMSAVMLLNNTSSIGSDSLHSGIDKSLAALDKFLGNGTGGPVRRIQKNGVCSFQVLTPVIKDILNSKTFYNTYRADFLTHIQEEFQEITDSMKSLSDKNDEFKKFYPLHCLLLQGIQTQIDSIKRKIGQRKSMRLIERLAKKRILKDENSAKDGENQPQIDTINQKSSKKQKSI